LTITRITAFAAAYLDSRPLLAWMQKEGKRMKSDDLPVASTHGNDRLTVSTHGTTGFVAGVLFGAFLGAGLALLLAPDRGEKTRKKLRQRMRSLRDDAREGLDRAGSATRKELRRRERRIRAELARARARAEKALD
jgi:gas vesicle protein